MTKIIYVTGATGFVGKSVCNDFEKFGYSVKKISRVELNNLSSWKFQEGSFVLHLAGLAHITDPKLVQKNKNNYFKVNSELTKELALKAKSENVKKFIFLSSMAVFKDPANEVKIIESSPQDPKSFYGQSKKLAEDYLKGIFSQGNQTCVVLRPPIIYGKGAKGNFQTLLKFANKKIVMPLLAAKNNKRSMIFLGNLIDAFKVVIEGNEKNSFIAYNISDNYDYSVCELYNLIFKALNKKSGVFYIPRFIMATGACFLSFIQTILKKELPFNKDVYEKLFTSYQVDINLFINDYNWKPPFKLQDEVTKIVLNESL